MEVLQQPVRGGGGSRGGGHVPFSKMPLRKNKRDRGTPFMFNSSFAPNIPAKRDNGAKRIYTKAFFILKWEKLP